MTAAARSRAVPAKGYGVKYSTITPARRKIPETAKTAISRRPMTGP